MNVRAICICALRNELMYEQYDIFDLQLPDTQAVVPAHHPTFVSVSWE